MTNFHAPGRQAMGAGTSSNFISKIGFVGKQQRLDIISSVLFSCFLLTIFIVKAHEASSVDFIEG